MFGLAVEHTIIHDVDLCSSSLGSNKLAHEMCVNISFFYFTIIGIIVIIVIIVQVNDLLETLGLTESAQRKGNFSLYSCFLNRLEFFAITVLPP